MDQKTHDKGLEIRKAVLGEAYVANALKNADAFNKPFQELVTEYCWGAVWGREELPRKTRSMLNLAMISILNRPHELRVHIKGALVNGVSKDEIDKG
jgi:4-carboxymuconolactone decarboxylase